MSAAAMTEADMRARVIAAVGQHGTRGWCRLTGLAPSMVSLYLNHQELPCYPAIAAALGYERVISYRKISPLRK